MKHIYTLLCLAALLVAKPLTAQNIGNLDGIYYQAVALDDSTKELVGMDIEAKPLYEKQIGVRFTITKGFNGEIEWQENDTTTTDKYGLFSLVIGKGEVISSAYARLLDIPWIDADQFLKVEISTRNDGNYKMVSYQKFMSVPYAFYCDDIADDAITSAKILNETIINDDIATGAVESSEIKDETIQTQDIANGAVTSSKIKDETIQAADIDTGAVGSSEIADESIQNQDIADGTIDLSTKIAPVSKNQILIGDTINTSSSPQLKALAAGKGIVIRQNADSVIVASTLGNGGVESNGNLTVNIQTVNSGAVWISNVLNVTLTNGQTAKVGDLVLASIDKPLLGCILSAYIHGIQGDKIQVRISIYNPTGNPVTFGNSVVVKLLVVN